MSYFHQQIRFGYLPDDMAVWLQKVARTRLKEIGGKGKCSSKDIDISIVNALDET